MFVSLDHLMGKRQYRKSRPVAEVVDEKQRIREKVLNVFRARAHSPGGGPAIIIKDSPTPVDILPAVICSSSSSDDSDRMEFMPAVQRRKYQKRRGGRGRKHQNKVETRTIQDDIVTQHLRKAQKVSVQRVNSSAPEDTSYSMITQNRITRHLGLFNCGKKSGRIVRDPLTIPETVRQLTREEFFKIVGNSDLDSNTPNPNMEERRVTPLQPSCLPLPSSAVSWRSSVCDQDPQLPSCPQFQELEESCVHSLQCLKVYENRDLVNETSRDLKKLFKSSDEAELRGGWPDSWNCRNSSSIMGLGDHLTPPFKQQATHGRELPKPEHEFSSSACLEAMPHVPMDIPASSSVVIMSSAAQHVLATAPQGMLPSTALNVCPQPSVGVQLPAPLNIPPSAPLNTCPPVPLDVHSTLQSCEEVLQTEVRGQVVTTRSGSVAKVGLLDDARSLLLQDCLAVQSCAAATSALQHSGHAGFCYSGGAYSSRNCQPKSLYPEESGVLQTSCMVQQGSRVGGEVGFPCVGTHPHSGMYCSGELGANGCSRRYDSDLSPHFNIPCPHHHPDLACRVCIGPHHCIAHVNSNVISEYVQQFPIIHHQDVFTVPSPSLSLQSTTPCLDHFHSRTDVNLDYLEMNYSHLDPDLCVSKPRFPHPLLDRDLTSPSSNLLSHSPSPPKLYPRKLY